MSKLSIGAAGLMSASVIALAATGVASAASTSSGDIGTSNIPRSVFKQDRLAATAQVLNTTTANVQAAAKDRTLKTLISNAGLTKATFHEKVRAQLTTNLENQGYSQDEVTIALQHRAIVRLHHRHDHK
jgi:hypothetical protein